MAVVVLVFLQNWRSTIIPLTAVPVAIIGTFAVMAAIGFSLNNLTLFGLVLAIGIVVDDAIVVVEAVEHHIEEGMQPRAGRPPGDGEVSGPVIAVALVLSAVFVPCAFISGITGQFFRQFALTIAVSTVISAFNSLTLSPALAALLLQGRSARKDVVGRTLDLLAGLVLPPVQLDLPPLHRPLHARGRPGPARQRPGAAGLRRPAASDVVDLDPTADRLHSRSGPEQTVRGHPAARLRLAGADAGRRRSRHRNLPQHARRHPHTVGRRPVVLARRQRLQFRQPVHHARRLRQAARPGALQRPDRRRAAARDRQESARGDRHHPRAAGGVRPRLGGRLQVHGRGPQRQRRPPEPANADQPAHRRRPERPETGHLAHGVPRQLAAAVRRARPQPVPDDGRQPAATFSPHCRSTSAPTTSTTSTTSAAPGRWSSRPRGGSATT